MNRVSPRVVLIVIAALLPLSTVSVSGGSRSSSESNTKGAILRMPSNSLRIEVDDNPKPFHLKNVDQRFRAGELAQFIDAFIGSLPESGGTTYLMMQSSTKRMVEGEEFFNKYLERLVAANGVTVVYLPPVTGDDPDSQLREFAANFKRNGPTNTKGTEP